MPRYRAVVRSRRPVQETFDYLATFSNAAQWDPGVVAGEQLDPGPVRLGTRFRLQVRLAGRGVPLTYEVTTYEPHHQVVLVAANWMLRSIDHITVTAAEEGSSVSYAADVRLRGLFALLDPLMRRGFKTVADRAAAGLSHALSQAQPRSRS